MTVLEKKSNVCLYSELMTKLTSTSELTAFSFKIATAYYTGRLKETSNGYRKSFLKF